MTVITYTGIPAELRMCSYQVESANGAGSDLVCVPGMVGWAVHQGLRVEGYPMRTHVCASSYDNINESVEPARVRTLYQDYPQPDVLVGIAGTTGLPTVAGMRRMLEAWGAPEGQAFGQIRSAVGDIAYAAAPIFILHRLGEGPEPLAACATRFCVVIQDDTRVRVDVDLDWISTDPDQRHRGLGHLMALEASRWLGMLARSITLDHRRGHRFAQCVTAVAANEDGHHLAHVFAQNFAIFCVTPELHENARRDYLGGRLDRGSARAGLGSITALAPLETAIALSMEDQVGEWLVFESSDVG